MPHYFETNNESDEVVSWYLQFHKPSRAVFVTLNFLVCDWTFWLESLIPPTSLVLFHDWKPEWIRITLRIARGVSGYSYVEILCSVIWASEEVKANSQRRMVSSTAKAKGTCHQQTMPYECLLCSKYLPIELKKLLEIQLIVSHWFWN